MEGGSTWLLGFRSVRVPKGHIRIHRTRLGFQQMQTKPTTEVFGSGEFGFGAS